MQKSSMDEVLDRLDEAILEILQSEGRISNVDLANRVKLSSSAVHGRIKRLEQRGAIRRYAALLDREKMGYDMLCFINVSLQLHQLEHVESFRQIVHQMPEVLECHHLTGEYDYLLKVVVRSRKDLQHFVVNKLTPVPGIARIYTSVVLMEIKSTTALPMANGRMGE
ncbi:MAG: AsnC family transcriptional regulator [Anaerolineaceae bacterium 4572_5.2]|nr:MAG: AsnC family transcriptional regulator [Anaerolineaceae bacterium 4572_5.2]